MNLISINERIIYESALNDVFLTFCRSITVTAALKIPKESVSDNNDDYDFAHDYNKGNEEFEYAYSEKEIFAVIKYLDRQDKDYSMLTQLAGAQVNLNSDFGLIRIKVKIADCDAVNSASSIKVDGKNTKIKFRDRPHGLFDSKYCTFYLERTP